MNGLGKREQRPGLRSKGNRVLIGVGVGFVAQVFAGLLGAEFGVRMLLWGIIGAITYAIATARS